MAEKLECTDRAVREAVSRIEKKFPKFLQVYHRSQPGRSEWKANAYVIGWQALINRCHVAFPWTDERRNECSTTEEQTFQARRKEPSCKLIEGELIEGTYRPKRDQPSADRTSVDPNEEVFREERVSESSETQPPPAPPDSPSMAKATTSVSGYCTAFDWEHLTPEAYEAAVAAEMQTPGAGFAVVKTASQEAWRASRKGDAK
jgi:hypothetical protein